jgi:hypothetical protein
MVVSAGDLTDAELYCLAPGGSPAPNAPTLGRVAVFLVGRCSMTRRTFWLVLVGLLTLIMPLAARAADPPSPTTVASFRTEGIPVAGPFEIYQSYAQFVPTACIPVHTHSGQVVVTVLTGALDRIGAGPESGTYTAGKSWVESAASPPHQACNNGPVEATAMATYLLPKGAPISNPVTQTAAAPSAGRTPSAPQTGGGGEAGFIRRLGDG